MRDASFAESELRQDAIGDEQPQQRLVLFSRRCSFEEAFGIAQDRRVPGGRRGVLGPGEREDLISDLVVEVERGVARCYPLVVLDSLYVS